MRTAVYLAQVVLLLALPLVFWRELRRRGVATWRLLGIGALTFVASQVVHIPVVYGLTALFARPGAWHPPPALKDPFNAVILGLLAGLCEELSRYVVLRTWLKRARSFRDALGFGAGHGGCEALLVALAAAATFGAMVWLRGGALQSLKVSPEALAKVQHQLDAYWSAPPWMPLLAVSERAVALIAHLAMCALVMQAVVRRRLWPLALAIGWHALVDGAAVLSMARLGVVATEAIVAASAPVSLWILVWSRRALRPAEAPIV